MERSTATLALGIACALTGCARLLGLEAPELADAWPSDDAGSGQGSDGGGGVGDGGGDGPITSNACPSSYQTVPFAGTYRFSMTAAPWTAAAADCADDGVNGSSKHTHLAVITSNTEYSALASMVTTDNWLGLSDLKSEGSLIWVTAESTTYPPATGSPWDFSEPNNTAGVDCVRMAASGLFGMIDCGTARPYICECDAYANDPSRY